MHALINDEKYLSLIDNYYLVLEKTGYIKQGTLERLLMYEFLVDFVNDVAFFITDKDYAMIDELLRKLFTNGGCLMPYPVFCTNRVELAKFRGDGNVRITEDAYRDKDGNLIGNDIRVLEEWNVRIV